MNDESLLNNYVLGTHSYTFIDERMHIGKIIQLFYIIFAQKYCFLVTCFVKIEYVRRIDGFMIETSTVLINCALNLRLIH